MRHRRRLAATVVLVLVMAGLGAATPSQAQTPGRTFSVDPSTDLVDGQSVQYAGSGFAPGSSWFVLQCIRGATDVTGVISKCAIQQNVSADATGSFSGFVNVARSFRPFGASQTVDCVTLAEGCAVSVFDASMTVIDAPITFRDPSIPRPEITLSPADHLEDGDVATVTGSGFPAGSDVTVAQCMADRPTSAEWCDARAPVNASAGATGAFVAEVTIHRGITTPSGEVTDCAADESTPNCEIAAVTSDGASEATAPIAMTFQRLLLAGAGGTLEVTPQGTVTVTGSLVCSPAISRAVEVSGIISQTVEERVITEEFHVTSTCPVVGAVWLTKVGGSRTQRFKAGTAKITTWAVDEADPLPDDATRLTVDADLVRPAA